MDYLMQTLKEITFEVPQFPYFEQSDNVHSATIQIFGPEESKVCYTHPYFITVPVTDALVTGYAPATGTVGTEITISGRNLEQITKIKFNEAEVTSDVFTSQTGDAVKFKAPAATTAAADNAVAIKAVWGGNKEIDVTVDENTNFLSFNDFWDTSEWAKPAMMWAIDRELIVGDNWDLKPQGDAVRAQAATIIWKFCETVAK